MRAGIGYDVHKLVENRELILGGVSIPYEKGLAGHSDADVLLHAVCDSLLGAAGLGDIGKHFPDSDPQYKGISSLVLLKEVLNKLRANNFVVVNIDAVIIAQAPKLSPYIEEMKDNIIQNTGLSKDCINIKSTTTEKLGFTGEKKGIAAQAVASIALDK